MRPDRDRDGVRLPAEAGVARSQSAGHARGRAAEAAATEAHHGGDPGRDPERGRNAEPDRTFANRRREELPDEAVRSRPVPGRRRRVRQDAALGLAANPAIRIARPADARHAVPRRTDGRARAVPRNRWIGVVLLVITREVGLDLVIRLAG